MRPNSDVLDSSPEYLLGLRVDELLAEFDRFENNFQARSPNLLIYLGILIN